MAFKNPAVSPLTESQEKLLAQLGSVKNILTLPNKRNMSIPEERQISTFDYMIRIAESTVGAAFIDIMLKKFMDQVFDTESDKLEKAIIKGIAKSLDHQNKHISQNPTQSNQDWLMANALPPLHTIMKVVKALIVKQIVAMIFGPSQKMTHDVQTAVNNNIPVDSNLPSDAQILEEVVAADSMFSVSKADGNQFGDQEFNTITLRERLKKGQVVFTISCQDVKISLPANFDSEVDAMVNSIVSVAGVQLPPGQTVMNPTVVFDYINLHVGNETQRINTQENKNAIKKSFLQILVEKILNLIIISTSPYLLDIFNRINTENPTLNLAIIGLIGTPKQLKDLSESDPAQFDNKKVFMSTVINALYALLLSIILKALIKEVKKLIRNAIAKRAATRRAAKFKRLAQINASLHDAVDTVEKAKAAANALKQFNNIFNYGDSNNA